MMNFQLCNTDFDFTIIYNKRRYTAHAKLVEDTSSPEAGSSLERWEVTLGDRLFRFQNNRPELSAKKSNKTPHWQIVKGKEYLTDKSKVADANLLFEDMFEEIERISYNEKKVTFQDVRNKR